MEKKNDDLKEKKGNKKVKQETISKSTTSKTKKSTLGKLEEKKAGKQEEKVLLEKKSQKLFRILSRIICIIARIVKVCAMVVAPVLFVAMIFIPIFSRNVEFMGNIIKINDANIVLNKDTVTFSIGDENRVLADNIPNMNDIMHFFNSNSKGQILTDIMLILGFTVIILVINIYIFQYIERLFNNFYQHKTPFEEENCANIKGIGNMMIASLCLSIIFSIVLNVLTDNLFTINFGSYSLFAIAIIFVSYFIFRYGTNMQKRLDTAIYE